MALATGDLLQFVDFQEYLGEEILNVYYYRWFSAPTFDNTAYEALHDSFVDRIVNGVKNLQNSMLEHTMVQIKNLSNGVDFREEAISITGAHSATEATALPSYVSVGFKLIRDSLVTRNGYKRYGGLVDSQVSGNDYNVTGSDESDLEIRLTDILTVGLIEVAAPVIVKRPIPVPAGSSYVYSSVTDATLVGLGTQNTRKQGVGA